MGSFKSIKVPRGARIVAMRSTKDSRIVAHGKALGKVLAKARKAGAKEPVILFVPQAGRRHIYASAATGGSSL